MTLVPHGERDFWGYGDRVPTVKWPGGARVAVQFVLNYEEGGENCILEGDASSEAFLSEIVGAAPIADRRHMNMESIYEYGSRSGFWRVHRLFTERQLPLTVFAVARALEQNQKIVDPMLKAGWEIASHGYRWIDYQHVPKQVEAAHIQKAVELHKQLTGSSPQGWYTGRSGPNTRSLVMEHVKPRYDADSYADDLPYWVGDDNGAPYLIVPYTLDANDMRFTTAQGFNSGEQFFQYLRDAFDALYGEGSESPKMMSIGLHCRLIGRPGRIQSLRRFLDYIGGHADVWVARRIDIAEHWHAHHKP